MLGTSFLYNKKLKPRANELRKDRNLSEALLWRELKNRQMLGLNFDRQKVIGNFIADFACEDKRIIIEVDGTSHIGREEYDRERDEYLTGAGFRVIRISTDDVKYNLDLTLQYLKEKIQRHAIPL